VVEINLLEVRMNNRFFVWALLLVVLVGSVSALGVTPARTTLDFKPSLSKTVDFEVINSGEKDIKLVLAVQGELADYIKLPSTSVSVSASERSKKLSYDLNLPSDLKPGLHTAEVYILELPSGSEVSEAYVRATLAVVTQVYVYVPYPGKYANADMRVINAGSDGKVTFVFPVVSAGEFDLTSVKAQVDIYNKMGEKVDSFTTESIAIPSGEKKELVYKWDASKVSVGEYRAVASLAYDEGTVNLEETFSVGSQDLELQEITTNRFSLGEIVKLEMLVENKWSEPISGAHIETSILNDRGDLVSKFESASYDVEPLKKQTFVSYWDTAGVKEGAYETEVAILYGDKKSTNSLKFQVAQNELKVIGLGYVISADGEGGSSNTLVVVLIAVIVVLVLVNLLWFMLLRKRLKK
jgi:hypothetical protein